MEKDEFTTKVIFKIEAPCEIEGRKLPRDIVAFFPENMMCYSHIGQHSEYSVEYCHDCKPATPEQYADLKAELESIGYNLEVVDG